MYDSFTLTSHVVKKDVGYREKNQTGACAPGLRSLSVQVTLAIKPAFYNDECRVETRSSCCERGDHADLFENWLLIKSVRSKNQLAIGFFYDSRLRHANGIPRDRPCERLKS